MVSELPERICELKGVNKDGNSFSIGCLMLLYESLVLVILNCFKILLLDNAPSARQGLKWPPLAYNVKIILI